MVRLPTVRPAVSRGTAPNSPPPQAGWTIHRVGDGTSPLIVHVPHSGTWLPEPERRDLLLDDAALEAELGKMTDWYTDRIGMEGLARACVPGVVFANTASRLLVDPERFLDEEEPMLSVGMGAVYLATSDQRPLRERDPERDQLLINTWFHPYAAAFADLIGRALAVHGRAIIVDLHSFPSKPLPYELDHSALRPEICIGTDPFHTPPAMLHNAREAFEDECWVVAENTPFAGTYVPLKHLGRSAQVTSVMIEIRRNLYQNEPGGAVHRGYDTVVDNVSRLFRALVRPDDPAE